MAEIYKTEMSRGMYFTVEHGRDVRERRRLGSVPKRSLR